MKLFLNTHDSQLLIYEKCRLAIFRIYITYLWLIGNNFYKYSLTLTITILYKYLYSCSFKNKSISLLLFYNIYPSNIILTLPIIKFNQYNILYLPSQLIFLFFTYISVLNISKSLSSSVFV